LSFLRDVFWILGPILLRSRLILHLHGSNFRRFCESAPWPLNALMRRLVRRAIRVFVLTAGAADRLKDLTEHDRIRVISNAALDPNGYQSSPTPPRRSAFRCLYLGSLADSKGYLDVLEAAALLRSHIPNLEMVLAGEWYDSREEAQSIIDRESLARTVRVVGVVSGPAKAQVLAEADVLVFPPRAPEGQPLVLLEGMAASLPIVTTASGYISETVIEGENALFVPPHDPRAIADAVRRLWSDPGLRKRMGERSRELYLERYTPDAFRSRLGQLMSELELELRSS